MVRPEPKLTTNNVHAFSILNESGTTMLELATRSEDSSRDWMDSIIDVSGNGGMYYHNTHATIAERAGTFPRGSTNSESNVISNNQFSAGGVSSLLRNRFRGIQFRSPDAAGARMRREEDNQQRKKDAKSVSIDEGNAEKAEAAE